MNDQNPNIPEIPLRAPGGMAPPPIPTAPPQLGGRRSLGADPAERVPITGIFSAVDALLRQPRRVMFQLKQAGAGGLIGSLLAITVVCSLVYGLVVGSFSMSEQLWAAPVKVATGLLISGFICLPSLYIFACLSGSQARLAEVLGLVAGLMGLMTILLLGFAPVALVFSQSTHSVVVMGCLHLAFWLVATIFGLRFLYAAFRHVQAKSDGGFQVWVLIFVAVALQMTTTLRPLVGRSPAFLPAATEKQFFVQHWMECFQDAPQDETKGNDNKTR